MIRSDHLGEQSRRASWASNSDDGVTTFPRDSLASSFVLSPENVTVLSAVKPAKAGSAKVLFCRPVVFQKS